MSRRRLYLSRHRKGSVLALTLFCMVVLLGIVALAIDTGYLLVARTELQCSADASAISAAWELIDEDALYGDSSMSEPIANARASAVWYAAQNSVCTKSPTVDANADNDPDGDVVLGTISDLSDRNAPMNYDDPTQYNAVTIRVRRTGTRNGNVPFFFGPIFGINSAPAEAEATAGFMKYIRGIKAPASGNFPFLPIALDLDTWNDLQNGLISTDDWSRDSSDNTVTDGPDGISEINLYPQGTGTPGNRGTVNIGGSSNSTSRIGRQITDGLTPGDLDYHGGELTFNENGELLLGGDPGISAGFKEELASIVGKPAVIPIFRELTGPGNNSVYTIVQFAGVCLVDVDLTSNDKRVIIQPAVVVTTGLIPAEDGNGSGTFIYSPPYLIR